jgi:hypothetical protein
MSKNKFSHRIGFTGEERKLITHHLIARVKPQSRKQRRWFDAVFTCLRLDEYEHELKTRNVILPADDDVVMTAFELESEPLDYLLETFNTEIPGGHARLILRVEERLAEVKDGKYELPTELQTASETAPPASKEA